MAESKFIVDINLNGHSIKEAVVESLSAAPTMKAGRFYFDTTLNRFGWCNGSAWVYSLEIKEISSTGTQVSLIDSSTNNIFTFRVLNGDDYIKLSNESGVINLTLDYEKLWDKFEELRINDKFITYQALIDDNKKTVGDIIYCITPANQGLYERVASGVGIDKWIRLTDGSGVFIKEGQVTENMLSSAYKEELQSKLDALQAAIDNQIWTMGFDPSDGSLYMIMGEYNSQIDSAEINQITGELDVYFNFE